MQKIVELAKARWFVYPGSEIYGWLANSWDYGPYGSILKENIKFLWQKEFIQKRDDMMLIDCAIIMNPKVWEASWHASGFADPLMDCKSCRARWRADKLIDQHLVDTKAEEPENYAWDKTDSKVLENYISFKKIACPDCKATDFTEIRRFNLMLKTSLWVTEDSSSQVYLRPETAQGQFVDFVNIVRTSRRKLPFWVAQVGKSFRNEITPWNFIFRTREFEQMEIEYFCEPWTDDALFAEWKSESERFFVEILGLNKDKVRFKPIKKEELPHYSKEAWDFEYEFSFGWWEIETLANRTNYDLSAHMKESKQNLSYFDPVKNTKFIPYVIEPAMWLSRLVLACLNDAYTEENLENWEKRVYLKFDPKVAPIKIWVLPVVKKLSDLWKQVYKQLTEDFICEYDDVGTIGKRYARFDEIWTPFCVTIDSENFEAWKVTVRFRDSMEQEVVDLSELNEWLRKRMR